MKRPTSFVYISALHSVFVVGTGFLFLLKPCITMTSQIFHPLLVAIFCHFFLAFLYFPDLLHFLCNILGLFLHIFLLEIDWGDIDCPHSHFFLSHMPFIFLAFIFTATSLRIPIDVSFEIAMN